MSNSDIVIPSELTTELEINTYRVVMAIKGSDIDISSPEEQQIYKAIMAAGGCAGKVSCCPVIKSVSAKSIAYGEEATVMNLGTPCEAELVFGIPEEKPGIPSAGGGYVDFKKGNELELKFVSEAVSVKTYEGFATQSGLLSISVRHDNLNIAGQDTFTVHYDGVIVYSTGMRSGENAILLPVYEGNQISVIINKRAKAPKATLFPYIV